jgi:hypothetical protein
MVNWLTTVLFKTKTKQRQAFAGELSLGKIVEILTSQRIICESKNHQLRQCDDFGRNWPYTMSRQNSEKREMVNSFTAIL